MARADSVPGVLEASATDGWEDTLLADGLQCPICMEFLCPPILLTCKHAFCRLCLLQSTQLAPDGRRCPECRAVIEIKDPARHPFDVPLEKKLRAAVPPETWEKRLAAREEELNAFLERVRQHLPVFFMRGVASKPGQPVGLHLFEPRYRVLIRRCWESNRRFLCTQQAPRAGEVGLVVEVEKASFLSDGKANIQGHGVSVVTLNKVWVEDGTHGLYYADVGERSDTSPVDDTNTTARGTATMSEAQAKMKLREAIRVGVPMYNRGDHQGCYDKYRSVAEHICQNLDAESSMRILLRRGLDDSHGAHNDSDYNTAAWTMRHAMDEALAMRAGTRTSQIGRSISDGPQSQPELPVFTLFPGPTVGNRVRLQLFEPRYRILAREAWASNDRLFIYSGSTPSPGEDVTAVKLISCEWLSSDNALIQGIGLATLSVLSLRTDTGKHGLLYATVTPESFRAIAMGSSGEPQEVTERAQPKCCVVQ